MPRMFLTLNDTVHPSTSAIQGHFHTTMPCIFMTLNDPVHPSTSAIQGHFHTTMPCIFMTLNDPVHPPTSVFRVITIDYRHNFYFQLSRNTGTVLCNGSYCMICYCMIYRSVRRSIGHNTDPVLMSCEALTVSGNITPRITLHFTPHRSSGDKFTSIGTVSSVFIESNALQHFPPCRSQPDCFSNGS